MEMPTSRLPRLPRPSRLLPALAALAVLGFGAPAVLEPGGWATSANPASTRAATPPAAAPSRPARASRAETRTGFRLTTYYTAVERFHHGRSVPVTGCLRPSCPDDSSALGSYPADFLSLVRLEGAGRVTSGPHAGRFLNWSYAVGYWIDTVPRDEHGHELQSFTTAAADAGALPRGTRFHVADCGHDRSSGDPIVAATCRRLQSAAWTVTDTFTPGYGGPRHVDLYVGEEDRPHFASTAQVLVDAAAARLRVQP